MSLSLHARRARLLALRDTIDALGGGALHLHSGPYPATPEAAPAGAPLAIIALAVPSFALHASAAEIALIPASGHAAQSGIVTWARYVDGAGNGVYQVDAGPPGSGAQLIVSDGAPVPTAQVYTGGEINVTHTISEP